MVYLQTKYTFSQIYNIDVCVYVFTFLPLVPSKNRMILISAQNVDPETYPLVISHTIWK